MKSTQSTNVIVVKTPGRHLAFPDICRLTNGSLLVVYREGSGHFDDDGRIMITRCPAPWNSLEFEPPEVVCDTDLDDRDPSVMQLSDGSVLLNFVRFRDKAQTGAVVDLPNEENEPFVQSVLMHESRLATVRSFDGGLHWEAPQDMTIPTLPKNLGDKLATTDAILELPSGDLLMPIHGVHGSFVLRSTDQGRSWLEATPLAVAPAPIFEEPTLGCLKDGSLVALLRTDHAGDGDLYQVRSHDEGRTWSSPERLPLWGFPAHLLTLTTGRLLATYGYRRNPHGIRYCQARRGSCWSLADEYGLRHDGHRDFGYPSSVELQKGQVFTVYYFTDRVHDPISGYSYIAGTWYTPK